MSPKYLDCFTFRVFRGVNVKKCVRENQKIDKFPTNRQLCVFLELGPTQFRDLIALFPRSRKGKEEKVYNRGAILLLIHV